MNKIETELAQEFNLKERAIITDYQGKTGEALGIIQLYRNAYELTSADYIDQVKYPYPEAFDPEWVHRTASSPDTIWKVVWDTLTDQPIGTGTILINRQDKKGYMRGIIIDPAYQGKGLAAFILVNAFKEVINEYRDVIKIFWTENRSAHPKSQKIAEASGMKPVGLLPNKDIFLDERESDILYVLYSMNTLKNRRPNPTLVPAVLPIFEVVGRQFRLDDAIPTHVHSTFGNGFNPTGHVTADKYNYHFFTYTANGKQLKFVVNPRVMVAENTWFSPDIDPTTLRTLLWFARQSLATVLYYMECYVSAFAPETQQAFVDAGFEATGYLPGWNVVDGQREDAVIFSWVKEKPPLDNLCLTRRATKLAKVFLS